MQSEVSAPPLPPGREGSCVESRVLGVPPPCLQVLDHLVEIQHALVNHIPSSCGVCSVRHPGWTVYWYEHQDCVIGESWNLHDLFPVLDFCGFNVEELAGDPVDIRPVVPDQLDNILDVL